MTDFPILFAMLLVLLVFLAILGLGILVGVYCFKVAEFKGNLNPTDPEIEALPRCSCFDVNDCDTQCRAKALFAKFPPEA